MSVSINQAQSVEKIKKKIESIATGADKSKREVKLPLTLSVGQSDTPRGRKHARATRRKKIVVF